MKKFGNKINEMDLILSGSGMLSAADQRGAVRYYLSAVDGELPVIGEVNGDQLLMDTAWTAGRATLEAFGARVRVEVTGVNMKNGTLTFWAAPVFKALGKVAKVPA